MAHHWIRKQLVRVGLSGPDSMLKNENFKFVSKIARYLNSKYQNMMLFHLEYIPWNTLNVFFLFFFGGGGGWGVGVGGWGGVAINVWHITGLENSSSRV